MRLGKKAKGTAEVAAPEGNGIGFNLRVKPPTHPGLNSTTVPAGIAHNDPDVRPPLSIDPEIRDLIPTLSKQERTDLEKSLRAEGCLDRLKGWSETGFLLDGHNRKEICDAFEIQYDVEWMTFSGRAEAIDFVLGLQLARRNVSDEQRAYLIGKRLENESQPHGRPKNLRAQVEPLKNGHKPKGKTAVRIAKESNVSPATVKRNGVFSKAVDRLGGPGSIVGRKLMDGQVKMSDAAAKLVRDLPAAKVVELAAGIGGGKFKTVEQGLVKTRATPVQRRIDARKAETAKPEMKPPTNQAEDWATVENRLVELLDIKDRKRVDAAVRELLVFVRARK
jgi:hypothetical protein